MGYLKNELTGFVPVEQATDIIKMVTRGSSVLRMAKVEEMKHEKKKFNVLTDGPGAYWVGEGERIKTRRDFNRKIILKEAGFWTIINLSILKTGSPLASDNGSSLQKVCHIGCMRYCLEDDDRFKTRKGTKTVCFR